MVEDREGWCRTVPSVLHFLLVFDRIQGRVLSERRFTDHRKALEERFRAERLHRANPGIEVVVLTAESKEALRRTHARYFQSVSELASMRRQQVAAVGEQSVAIE
jgi:hypothetical protein